MTACPRCGEAVERGQEYCVECGTRLPGPGPVGAVDDPGRGWMRRSLLALLVAAAGGATAVAAAGSGGGSATLLTATGGFAQVPAVGTVAAPGVVGSSGIETWPSTAGWTITLLSVPQTAGRKLAVAEARRAQRAGLGRVGILDSSAYASLHPGYWIVFSDVYASQAEATSALQSAKAFSGAASVRHVVP